MEPGDRQVEELASALRQRLIPWVRDGGIARLVLVDAPLVLPAGVSARALGPLPPVEHSRGHAYLIERHWPAEGLHAVRLPGIACVLDGEAALPVGLPRRPSNASSAAPDSVDAHLLTCPPGTFCLFPPGSTHPDGRRGHSASSAGESGLTRLFWLLFMPSGVFCHCCYSRAADHRRGPHLLITDGDLLTLAQLLLSELRSRSVNTAEVAQSLLLALLLRVEQDLATGRYTHGGRALAVHQDLPNASPLVRQACQFIQQHLEQPLGLARIAAQVYVSPPHLSRRFRLELGQSVMEYVTLCRIDAAKSLLSNTDFAVHEVGEMVGFSDPSYFTRVFTERVGRSPSEHRRADPLAETTGESGRGEHFFTIPS